MSKNTFLTYSRKIILLKTLTITLSLVPMFFFENCSNYKATDLATMNSQSVPELTDPNDSILSNPNNGQTGPTNTTIPGQTTTVPDNNTVTSVANLNFTIKSVKYKVNGFPGVLALPGDKLIWIFKSDNGQNISTFIKKIIDSKSNAQMKVTNVSVDANTGVTSTLTSLFPASSNFKEISETEFSFDTSYAKYGNSGAIKVDFYIGNTLYTSSKTNEYQDYLKEHFIKQTPNSFYYQGPNKQFYFDYTLTESSRTPWSTIAKIDRAYLLSDFLNENDFIRQDCTLLAKDNNAKSIKFKCSGMAPANARNSANVFFLFQNANAESIVSTGRYVAHAIQQEKLLNTYTPGDQKVSQLVRLNNNEYVGIWISSYQLLSNNNALVMQRFDTDLNPFGDEVILSSSVDSIRYAKISALKNGNYVVAWGGYGKDSSQRYVDVIFYQLFSPTHSKIGGLQQLMLAYSQVGDNPYSLVATSDGGFVIAYMDKISIGSYFQTEMHFKLQKFDSAGAITYQVFDIRKPDDFARLVATELSNKEIVVAWEIGTFTGDNQINVQILNSDLTKKTDPFLISNTLGKHRAPEISSLSNGGFVMSWEMNNNSLMSKIFSSSGTTVNEFLIGKNNYASNSKKIIGLTGGGFAMAWSGFTTATYDIDMEHEVFYKVFDDNGSATSSQTLVNQTQDDSQISNSIITGPNGRELVITWQSNHPGSTLFYNWMASRDILYTKIPNSSW